jgi:DEP domain-containing protein 5
MSRNASSTPTVRKGASWTSHLRQQSRTSLGVPAPDSPTSPRASSSHPDLRPEPQTPRKGRFERRCTVTVNDNYSRDEVLLNLDLMGPDVKHGTLMSMTVVESDKPSSANQGAVGKPPNQDGARARTTMPVPGDGDKAAGKRYIFVVKDMSKELKTRYPHREVYVVKHIANKFGMGNGTQVVLNMVRSSSNMPNCNEC